MPNVIDVLRRSNPWWHGEFKVDFKNRRVYDQVKKYMPLPQIIAFTGLRRVGKTTIMYKLAEDAIAGKTDPNNVLYFSFDDFGSIDLLDLIKEYEKMTDRTLENGNYLILFDEIQKLADWEEQLKRLYDLYGKRAKIIISGSESLFIRKKSKESLGGRIFEFKVEQLFFGEFIGFKNIKVNPIGINEENLLKAFDGFIKTQGFPELESIKDQEIIRKYIKENIIDKVIYKDIPRTFEIENPQVLETILEMLMDNPGQVINLVDLAKELGISRLTVSRYLFYLESSFLIKKLYNFSKNRRKVERKLKKYYPTVIATELAFNEADLYRSKVFEWCGIKELNPEFFWRDAYKNEVDMVLFWDKSFVPIGIKYGKIEVGGLRAFLSKFKIKNGYILSYTMEQDIDSEWGKVVVIPMFKFILEQRRKDFEL